MTPNLDLGDTRLIIEEAKRHDLLRNQAAYCLATAFHESAHTMKPVRETLASTDDIAIQRLERAWAAGNLPSVRTPYWRRDADGKTWLGRGYPQTTHKANYERMGRRLGIDLTTDPNVMLEPDVAMRVMIVGMSEGLFTGKRLSDYITLQRSNFTAARKIINGSDRALDIAAVARAYDSALKAEGYGVDTPEAPPPSPLEQALADLKDAQADAAAAKTKAATLQAENDRLRDILEDAASIIALGVKP